MGEEVIMIDLLVKDIKELVCVSSSGKVLSGEAMAKPDIVENCSLAVNAGMIIDFGNTKDICDRYQAVEIIDAAHKTVTPGFVDPHTHPVFVHTRENEFEMRILGKSYVEISQSGGGIRSTIRTTRDAEEQTLYNLARKRIERMISLGTTTLEAKSGYGLSTASELKQLRVIKRLQENLPIDIIPTFMGAHEFPIEYKDHHQRYIDLLCSEMIPAVKEQSIAEFCDIFTEAHVYNLSETRQVLQTAKNLGLKLKMHADEIEPMGGAELAAELGCTSADHLGVTSATGIAAMQEHQVIPVLLPATLFSLARATYAPARDMIIAGLPVALATDFNPGSCNCDSMCFVMTLACLNMKMTPGEAIAASTINAAAAINREHEVGSISIGKKADFLIWDVPSYKFLPYHFGSSHLESVYKAGKLIYQNAMHVTALGSMIHPDPSEYPSSLSSSLQ
jgi:imidazolonepropionase